MTREEYKKLFIDTAKSDDLDKSGAVLYSSLNTTEKINEKEGRVMFLGINPGGNGEEMPEYTIDNHFSKLDNDFNEYLNGDWGAEKGKSKLQTRVQEFFKAFDLDILKVYSSNLFFLRSSDVDFFNGYEFYLYANKYWDFHLEFIKRLDTKVIISNGIGWKSAFNYIFERYKPKNAEYQNSGHGNWSIGYFDVNIENYLIRVVGIPHLSYYSVKEKGNHLSWLKDKMYEKII
jgi:hypothetical protein